MQLLGPDPTSVWENYTDKANSQCAFSNLLFSAINIGEGGATGAGSARHYGPVQVAMPDDGGF